MKGDTAQTGTATTNSSVEKNGKDGKKTAVKNKKPAAINIIWLSLILVSIVVAAYTGKMDAITVASFDSAKSAVTLAIGLIGAMALWLGIMKIVEAAGLMRLVARALRPIMVRLFPDVPSDHPAMSAIIMNMAANALGLGNAATPIGIKAMTELDRLNPEKGTATNAMCLFLAINTSSVTILPLGVIAVRAAAGAKSPAAILIPSIFATACSTVVAIVVAKLLARRSEPVVTSEKKPTDEKSADEFDAEHAEKSIQLIPPGIFGKIFALVFIGLIAAAIPYRIITSEAPLVFDLSMITYATKWLIPLLMAGFLLYGFLRGINVYEVLTDGAKEGFQVAIRIIPFLVAIFVAIGMIRASGALDLFAGLIEPALSLVGMPAEALPMALIRPLSGTGAYGIMAEIVNRAPDSFAAYLASVLQGSTETTFYVLAVYFGSVGIRRTRHALPAALLADTAAVAAALFISHLMFRG